MERQFSMQTPSLSILLTGGLGFLGQHLALAMVQAGHKVDLLRRHGKCLPWRHPNLKYAEGDLTDFFDVCNAVAEKDLVVHAGGRVSFRRLDRPKIWNDNVQGTASLIQAMQMESPQARLIHISSIAALGRSFQPARVNESQIWKNDPANTWYALSKYQAELEVWRAVEEGMKATVLSPAVVLGPGPWDSGTGTLFPRVHKGLHWYPPGNTGFVDVRDVASALISEIEQPSFGQRFILCSENAAWKDVLQGMANELGQNGPQHCLPTSALLPFAKAIEWFLSRFSLPTLIPYEMLLNSSLNHWYSSERFLTAHPDFRFRPLKETLKDTSKAYLDSL